MTVEIRFLPDDVTIEAESGEPMLEVAERAGVYIPTGCLMGSCHACEVEIDSNVSVCACISAIPGGKQKLTINVYEDPAW